MHEIGKHPAVAMASASFRHGAIEVVDGNFHAVVFAPAGPTYELSRGLVRDIDSYGGHATLVESQLPANVAPLLEAIPAQLAGYHLAKAKELTPGAFRYVAQVTREE